MKNDDRGATATSPQGATSAARCPVMSHPQTASGSTANRHWWPEQLNLKGVELVVDRSTTGSNSVGFGGLSVDGRQAQRTSSDTADELKHLAKVRVAGSNPVFRSREVAF